MTFPFGRKKKMCQYKGQQLLIIAGLFCLVYNPPIFPINAMHLVGLLSIIYLLVHFGYTAAMLRSLKIGGIMLGVILWFAYLLMVVVFLNAQDWMNTVTPLYFIVDIVPFGMAVKIASEKNRWSVDNFINMVIVTAILHAVLALAAFFSPEIQSCFITQFLDYGYDDVIVGMSEHRFYGLASWLTFDMPILQTVLALLVIHPSRKLIISDYITALLLLFSAIINARVTIVVAAIGFFTMIILDRIPLTRRLKYGIVLVAIIIIAAVILLPIIATWAPSTAAWISKGFEEILEFLFDDREEISRGYFSYILDPNKYRLPDSPIALLFGAGHPTMGMTEKYGFGSDIGYINDLWLGGVIYVFLLYLFFAAIMLALRRSSNPRVSFFGTFMLIMYPFVNVKGIAASINEFSCFMFLLYLIAVNKPCVDFGSCNLSTQFKNDLRTDENDTRKNIRYRSSI